MGKEEDGRAWGGVDASLGSSRMSVFGEPLAPVSVNRCGTQHGTTSR
jgi:hypothetical protein